MKSEFIIPFFVSLSMILAEVCLSGVPRELTQEEIAKIEQWQPDSKILNWEISGQIEGDMVLDLQPRNVMKNEKRRWPRNTLVYKFSNEITERRQKLIKANLNYLCSKTYLRHREASEKDKGYIFITNVKSGCWSTVGYSGGKQRMNLQEKGCMYNGTILHEFLHSLGFFHQHSTPKRDSYITIIWDNIEDKHKGAFKKYNDNFLTDFGLPYDYDSIMHYGKFAFAKNNQPTIETKHGEVIGKSRKLSKIDIRKLKIMYPEIKPPKLTEHTQPVSSDDQPLSKFMSLSVFYLCFIHFLL